MSGQTRKKQRGRQDRPLVREGLVGDRLVQPEAIGDGSLDRVRLTSLPGRESERQFAQSPR